LLASLGQAIRAMLALAKCLVYSDGEERMAYVLAAVHMDSSESAVGGPTDCTTVRPIRNDDMQQGDYYIVQSDSWHGRADPWHGTSHLARRPAECALAFNFGDRLASLSVEEWWCHLRDVHDPFLAIYDNCAGQRYGLLVSQSDRSFSSAGYGTAELHDPTRPGPVWIPELGVLAARSLRQMRTQTSLLFAFVLNF